MGLHASCDLPRLLFRWRMAQFRPFVCWLPGHVQGPATSCKCPCFVTASLVVLTFVRFSFLNSCATHNVNFCLLQLSIGKRRIMARALTPSVRNPLGLQSGVLPLPSGQSPLPPEASDNNGCLKASLSSASDGKMECDALQSAQRRSTPNSAPDAVNETSRQTSGSDSHCAITEAGSSEQLALDLDPGYVEAGASGLCMCSYTTHQSVVIGLADDVKQHG